MTAACHIVALARWPRAGRVKTRLARFLGEEAALRLHLGMVADARARLARLAREGWTPRLLWADAPEDDPAVRARLRRRPREALQADGDLGARMAAAIRGSLGEGAAACVIIGTDSPTFPDARIVAARRALGHAELVFGPADDGGYYLVAARRLRPEVFTGIAWGTPHVLETSLAVARRAGIEPALIAPHYDVDRPGDLERLASELRSDPACARIARHTRRALDRVTS